MSKVLTFVWKEGGFSLISFFMNLIVFVLFYKFRFFLSSFTFSFFFIAAEKTCSLFFVFI